MGIADVAKAALEEIPLSSVLRERVLLALDRLTEAEGKIETLQTEQGSLKAELKRERIDHEQTKKELKRLQELLHEEVRLVLGVEFRKGARTGEVWQPFCPKCHLPVVFSNDPSDPMYCMDRQGCLWESYYASYRVQAESQKLI